ncbi:gamma-glutamylcyclotransferase family protein [Aestuariibius insulae]|uniref:gamma-glutamylcyclotransferase family protein n=1 Tax=Aestuariibius insulae TaxID=2058287 RepID=UPI00345EE9ED
MIHPRFFGYGSLVNTRTHSYPDPRKARLDGWRREWRSTDHHPYAFLSAHPSEGTALDGLTADVPNHDWAALDAREAGYERQDVTGRITGGHPEATQIAVYQVTTPAGPEFKPILLSYLDVVVQGYLATFGEAGVADFFATTDRWETGLLDDRAAPLYPRAQTLTSTERDHVDAALARLDIPKEVA